MIGMKKKMKAALPAALFSMILLTGCGAQRAAQNAEAEAETSRAYTGTTATSAPAVTEITHTDVSDRGNDLYEDDDIHRKTDSEPDIIDRADSAIDAAGREVSDFFDDTEDALEQYD